MSWLFERFIVPSEIHGEMTCIRSFGRWYIGAGGTGQASSYLNRMWRQALRRTIPKSHPIKNILILGCGTGGAFREFYRRFPKAHIVTTEIDPVMIELAKRCGFLKGVPWPEIHMGRSEEILPTVHGAFDLIVSDMFIGRDVATETSSATVMRELTRLLRPNGHLILNAYSEPSYADRFSPTFCLVQQWVYKENHLAHFRPHGAGVIGDERPPGYVPYFSCKAYLEREYRGRPGFEVVNAGDAVGIRQSFGAFLIERYHSNVEPNVERGRLKFVMWDSWNVIKPPRGWRHLPGMPRRALMGYAEVPTTGDVSIGWSELARRERKKWLTQSEWMIKEVEAEGYCAAYAKSGKTEVLIREFSASIRRKQKFQCELTHLYGVVSRETGELIAGFATLDIPEIRTSLHVSGFVLPKARAIPVGVGLVGHWFTESQRRGMRYCEFDGFYAPGAPRSWKGFSRFKAQFGTRFVAYPKSFWKVVW